MVALFVFITGSGSVFAAESNVQISGFLSTIFSKGYNKTNSEYANGLAGKDVEMDTRDSHLGVQFSSAINPDMNVTAQFISRGGEAENYNLETDWAYVDYSILQHLRLRVGKYKIPEFIASDYLDVGYAYPWVRPPQDVYGTNPLISLNGLDLLYKVELGESKLFVDLYYGDGTHKTFVQPRSYDLLLAKYGPAGPVAGFEKGQSLLFDTHNTVGASIKYAAPHYTARIGYFETKVDQAEFGMDNLPGAFGGVGFTMDIHNIVAYAEFIRRNTDPEMETAFPDQDAWYVTLGYRMGKFLPSVTLSQIKKGLDKSDYAIEETSTAVDFRYDVATSADIKFQAMYVKPKDGNHGLFSDPVKDGTVITAAFDVIF